MIRKTFFFCCLLLVIRLSFSSHCFGQDSLRYTFEFNAHKGSILPHRDTLRKTARGAHPTTIELGFSWRDASRKGFEKANRYTENGILVGYTHFDKKNILGEGFYYMMYTEPQLTLNKKINFSLRASAGITYLNKVYDFTDNPDNRFYSSPVSGLIRVGFHANYSITSSWQVSAGANFNHISNGGMRVPNLGMNYPTVSMGFKYLINDVDLVDRAKKDIYHKSLRYHAHLFTASRLVRDWDADAPRKQMIGLSMALSRQFNHLSSWMVGTELSHDGSLPITGKVFERFDDSPVIISVTGGHLLTIGRVEFSQLLGVYLFKQYGNDIPVFQRYTLLYAATKNIRAGFSLKAHAEVAELIDLRLGINFGVSSKR
ncbi:acyloxyacyl hydrolase [Chryseotalea sanaruensis]|uniref:Acyloxyacyl hydrolase n=1 Tax=Chryseotalea sanaruensis TaxID=2482724 RepID=A0A401U6R6_9BACT|nr:acyloxyacyl hydrolase [Chryseotalea sanaruensis]GCC50631.1 acyloxyacyl hydrolase [Chryseotalea sanaruensis]